MYMNITHNIHACIVYVISCYTVEQRLLTLV